MMNLNNSSSGSVNSKEKELPPIPPSTSESNESSTESSESEILQAKSLRRKNFKQLSLNNDSNESNVDPVSLKIEANSLRQKRNNIRPAPLLNLNGNSNFAQSTSNRSSLSSNNSINLSHRNIDPDSVSSTDNIINQFSNLDLHNDHKPHNKQYVRKRQTVISSISPTKSTSSSLASPLEKNSGNHHGSNNIHEENPSPVFSTTSSIKFNNKDLVTLKNLGSGNSGTVSKILHVPSQKIMAKKIIPIESKLIIQNQIIRELKILHECQSPYIIEFYGAFLNNNNTIVICMEYCNCGSLDKILSLCTPRQFPLAVLKKLSFSILSGLVYLYENHKIIHRDIKPSNVLMTHKGDFRLCDFGVSRELTNSLAMADTFVGTSTYMSPERIQGLNYGIKSDIWSTGLMLIELASGQSIWNDKATTVSDLTDQSSSKDSHNGNGSLGGDGPEGILDLLQRIVNEDPPSLYHRINPITKSKFDEDLCAFVSLCLIKDDESRKSPWELLQENFLSGVSSGKFDKEVKQWSKNIRQLHKQS